jgi:acetyl esterase/lipase
LLATAGALVATALLSGCATHLGKQGDATTTTQPTRHAFTVQRNQVYSPEGWPQALMADVYRTAAEGLRPAVLLIHGGGWEVPDRRHQMESIARRLAERGYVVVNATYRLAPAHQHPAPLEDLHQALAWMSARSAALSIDPSRMATFGYSAGGHLAALLGAQQPTQAPAVRAVVAGGAPTDLSKWRSGRLVVQYLGGARDEMPARYAEASPVTQIKPGHPPVFLYHGQADDLVPVDHSLDYKAALDRAGVRNELFLTRGLGHITAFLLDGPAVEAAIGFLDRELR